MKDTKLIATTSLFAATITLVTAYFLHIPIPTGGYVHVGDAVIYLVACLLPTPYAIAAAAIGAGLADLLTAPVWVLPTLVIKSLVVLLFSCKHDRILHRNNICAIFLAGIISPVGYGLAGAVMTGSTAGFYTQLIGTLGQSIASGVIFAILASALEKRNVKLY